jgi:hypothetical protein
MLRLQSVREKDHATVGLRIVKEVDENHHRNFRPQKPGGGFSRRLKFRRFALQSGFQKFPLFGRNPFRLAWMVADEKPPDGQPDKWQATFENQHDFPVVGAEQPASDRRGCGDGERLAEVPCSVGPRTFRPRKPMRQQNHRGGINAALRRAQQKTHHFKFPKRFRQAAADGAQSPENEAYTDQLFLRSNDWPKTHPMPATKRSPEKKSPPPALSCGRPSTDRASWTKFWGPTRAIHSSGPRTKWCT